MRPLIYVLVFALQFDLASITNSLAEMDAEEANDLYDVRYALEIRALETALEKGISQEALDTLKGLNAEYERWMDDHGVVSRSRCPRRPPAAQGIPTMPPEIA